MWRKASHTTSEMPSEVEAALPYLMILLTSSSDKRGTLAVPKLLKMREAPSPSVFIILSRFLELEKCLSLSLVSIKKNKKQKTELQSQNPAAFPACSVMMVYRRILFYTLGHKRDPWLSQAALLSWAAGWRNIARLGSTLQAQVSSSTKTGQQGCLLKGPHALNCPFCPDPGHPTAS